jgi:N-acetylglutamate synthase-like GNAT family acetyltransferase
MLIEGKLLNFSDDLTEVRKIQESVFCNEDMVKNIEDEYAFAVHAVAYQGTDKKCAVAAGSMAYDGEICRLGRVAVLKPYRGNHYGDFIVRILLNKAFTSGIEKVYTYASPDNLGFFSTIGFKAEHEKDGLTAMSITSTQLVTKCQISKNFIGNSGNCQKNAFKK